ncbi:MAG: helix-turn-helix transcriptional regulator [Clostridia bacterium]|nr:helix-turn-helix transcriptional regulator [Clostridia bacterium]
MVENVDESCLLIKKNANIVEEARANMPSDEMLIDLAELFKVFGDSTRTKIISALTYSEMCVDVLSATIDMTKSAVSHQLRILRQMKIVKYRKCGKEVYYSLDDEHILKIYDLASEHLAE